MTRTGHQPHTTLRQRIHRWANTNAPTTVLAAGLLAAIIAI